MPSTYSSNLRVELQATGENRSTWGSKANAVFQRLEEAITNVSSIALSNANYTLTTSNGGPDQARSMALNVTGALTAIRTVTVPAVAKLYVVRNATTGGFAINISNGTNSVQIPNGQWDFVWTDGTAMYRTDTQGELFAAPTKTTPVNADSFLGFNSASSNALMRVTWQNIVSTLTTAFNSLYAAVGRTISAGNGLTGGGTLAADRTITMGTPGSITNSSTNSVSTSSHTHALGFTAAEIYTGSSSSLTDYPIGTMLWVSDAKGAYDSGTGQYYRLILNSSHTIYRTDWQGGSGTSTGFSLAVGDAALSGTWRFRGGGIGNGVTLPFGQEGGLFQRTS